MVGRIYKQDLYTLPHTKHESSRSCSFCYVFPIVSLCELMTPGVGSFLTPGTRLAACIKSNTQNKKALDRVALKDFLKCFSHDVHGRDLYGPQGHGCQDL